MSFSLRLAVRLASLVPVLVTASGCGFAGGFVRDTVTQVQIHQPGFRIVKENLTATAMVITVLCTIPVDDKPYTTLVKELNEQAGLRRNQMLVNFREDRAFRHYLFFACVQQFTLSADVIEFVAPPVTRVATGD